MEKNPDERPARRVWPWLWLAAAPAVIAGGWGAADIFWPAGALALLWTLGAFGASLASVVHPIAEIGLGRRWFAAASLAAVMAAALAGMAISRAAMSPERRAEIDAESAERAAERAEAERVAAAAEAEEKAIMERAAARIAANKARLAAESGVPTQCAGVNEYEVVAAGEAAVRAQLKNPRGAKFSPMRETQWRQTGACAYAVTGWVDATNSFNATIRSRYAADVRRDGEGWTGAAMLAE